MHPYIAELKEQYRQNKISRREFMRMAALLGLSMSSITAFLASCAPQETATPAPTEAPAEPTATTAAAAEPTTPPEPTATPEPASGIKRGGELRVGVDQCLFNMEDIHAASWSQFNLWRNVAEKLTVINQDNITTPWLLEGWDVSDDLMTWTLDVRQGINFNHGPELTAADVVWNIQRWLDPEVGSSTAGLMGAYLAATDIEEVDDYTVKLHLSQPQIAVPEHLAHNPCAILSQDFEGDWTKQPVGTGPYTLEEFFAEESAMVKRREDYWRMGEDGDPLPYMDSIRFLHIESDAGVVVPALGSKEMDLALILPPWLDAMSEIDVKVVSQNSSRTHVIRMRADTAPFDDINVRNAIKACQDREEMLEVTERGFGALGQDHHVAPIHPAYCEMETPPRDIEKAKALLAESGYEDGIEITIATPNADPQLTMAQLLKEQCAPAGINITIEAMPSSMYWDQWTDVPLGITSWTHRPLATMVLALAYRSGVAWNETHWSNERFDELLTQAEGTVDVEARREIMCEIETLMRDEGPVAIPRFTDFMWAHTPRVQNYRAAPQDHFMLDEVWIDEEV